VDFQLSDDQKALRDGIRSFCEGRVPVDTLRELEAKPELDRGLWGELAEMGVFGLRLPESDGGVGLGTGDAVLVFAELGRRLVPGPLVWTHLAAGLVDGAASGEAIVGGVDLLGPQPDPILVEHLQSLDVLLVLRPDGVFRVDPRDVQAQAVATSLDPLTPVHHAGDLPRGELLGDADAAARLRLEGAALAAGQLLGICEATVELAVAYAKEREQFGRPIGSFQALKHLLADMFVRQEAARAAAYAAGVTLDQPDVGDVLRSVAGAKLVAGEAAVKNARACIQVHGGMGYTWEVPVHYYLKRAYVLASQFGDAEEWAGDVARRLDGEAA
jgi:alkylation response protein AidB-like acyl-CoA dehydrogenase